MKNKEKSVGGLTKGIEMLFKKNKTDYLKGHGRFLGPNEIEVLASDGSKSVVKAKNVIIATGSDPSPFPGITIDEQTFVTSTGALSLKQIPKKMAVIGGGIIGLEMASVWSRLGSEVTVVEYMGAIGAGMDGDMAKTFHRILQKQGLKFKLNTKVLGATKTADGKVTIQTEPAKGGAKEDLADMDVVLLSIGRRPYTDNLGLENIGLKPDTKGRIQIDDQFRTAVPHVRAIGDVVTGPMLAHKAEEEGIAAVEYIISGHGHVNYDAIPSVIYTYPEVAWVGKTEEEVKASGTEYRVGSFPFAANSRAKTMDDYEGMIKVIADAKTDRILGAHIIGPVSDYFYHILFMALETNQLMYNFYVQNAGEMIAEAVLGIEYGASSEDIARTCHAHPTLSEAFKEACMATYGKAIHF